MKKILLVSGDSYTDPNFVSDFHPELDTSWPKWPELLAKKLDMICINLGKSGAGNEYIYSSLLDYITDNKNSIENIGLVIAGWSQCQRKDYQSGQSGRWTNERLDPHGDAPSWVNRSLKYYLSFQILCERYNLNYLHFQMINLYTDVLYGLKYGHREQVNNDKLIGKTIPYKGYYHQDLQRILRYIMSYENKINTEKFWGWPIARQLDGYTMCSWGSPIFSDEEKKIYKISELDDHPNREGQEKIMEYIYDRLG